MTFGMMSCWRGAGTWRADRGRTARLTAERGAIYLAFHLVHEESGSAAPLLTGAAVDGVWMHAGDRGRSVVDAIFDEAGAARLAEITAANIGRQLAVVTGNRVLMAPTIREAIGGGRLIIAGAFGDGEAFVLGGLPAPLTLVSEELWNASAATARSKGLGEPTPFC